MKDRLKDLLRVVKTGVHSCLQASRHEWSRYFIASLHELLNSDPSAHHPNLITKAIYINIVKTQPSLNYLHYSILRLKKKSQPRLQFYILIFNYLVRSSSHCLNQSLLNNPNTKQLIESWISKNNLLSNMRKQLRIIRFLRKHSVLQFKFKFCVKIKT